MWRISYIPSIILMFDFLIILNQISRYSCASWCSWSGVQCRMVDANNICSFFTSRSCACPAANGISNTCVGPAMKIISSQFKCATSRACTPLQSVSSWCQWNLWSEWNSLNLCVNNLNIQQRVRRRQCNCATSWSTDLCSTNSIVEYLNQNVVADACTSLSWCDWSEWNGCSRDFCSSDSQSRSRTCGCDKAVNSLCSNQNWTSLEVRNCSSSYCFNGDVTFNSTTDGINRSTIVGALILACLSVALTASIAFIICLKMKRAYRHHMATGINCQLQVTESTEPNISSACFNNGFSPYLAPPPFEGQNDSFVTMHDEPPPSYDECIKTQTSTNAEQIISA